MVKSWLMVVLFFFCIFASPLTAWDRSYAVKGIAESLGAVEGVAFSNVQNPDVTGQLTDSKGDVYSFEGTWVGNGQISGETDTGDSVQLSTQ